jgi:hypothetical protein
MEGERVASIRAGARGCGAAWSVVARFDCGAWRRDTGRIVEAHSGSSLLLAVVRVSDHVCASRGVECGVLGWE